jgi:hypothetical protein
MRNIPDKAILDLRPHRHKWKITKQISLPMFTSRTWYKCKCGAKKEEYENPAGKFGKKIKETELKEKLEKACWCCSDCGKKYAKRRYELSTWHRGKCDICGEKKDVTEARDFFYFK